MKKKINPNPDLNLEVVDILKTLSQLGSPENLVGQRRFGIEIEKSFGVSMPNIRMVAREYKYNHELALLLWATGYREARILAGIIDEPQKVIPRQMDAWTNDFNSWDLCDQVCGGLFIKTPYAAAKVFEYAKRSEEYVKRAGFSILAYIAVHQKKLPNEAFAQFYPLLEQEAWDDRNFVRKALNWALRSIGKRNATLRTEALTVAYRILAQNTKSAKWIAKDAIRELEGK
jgi:3-methyladenine DNA glycosylase AlkD